MDEKERERREDLQRRSEILKQRKANKIQLGKKLKKGKIKAKVVSEKIRNGKIKVDIAHAGKAGKGVWVPKHFFGE